MSKIITALLLLVSTAAFSQELQGELYIKRGYPESTTFCHLQPVYFKITKRRVILTSPEVSFTIKVNKRTKYAWYGKDNDLKYRIQATVKDDHVIFVFIPEQGQTTVVSNKDICK